MNIKQSLVLFSSLFFSISAMSASKWSGDWFEIEVILISQLDDKAKLKESFTDQSFALDYANSLDLFTPFLNPDIASLKQQLPLCNQVNDQRTYVEQSTVWPTFYLNKTLATLNEEQLAAHQLVTEESNNIQLSETMNQVVNDSDSTKQPTSLTSSNSSSLENDEFNESSALQNHVDESGLGEGEGNDEDEIDDIQITKAQQALVLAAEHAFIAKSLPKIDAYPHYAKTNKHQNDTSVLCQIPENEYNQLNVDKNLYSYHGYLVNKIPSVINDAENIDSEVPYLLNADSLKLKDIVTQLRRSRDFRPLLHFAWRQPVFEKQTSQPLKVFAGDNIQGQYLKNLARYHEQQKASLHEEQMFNNIFALSASQAERDIIETDTQETSSAQTISEQLKAEKINEILTGISQIETVEEVVASLTKQADDTQVMYPIDTNVMLPKPIPPVQPWYVEGLIDVYLIGNYLHVANDFSILNMTLAEQESLKLKTSIVGNTVNNDEAVNTPKVMPIRMTQDRRMISQETHYFDHPYMGIIMQIRRHQRPEITLEDSAQTLGGASN